MHAIQGRQQNHEKRTKCCLIAHVLRMHSNFKQQSAPARSHSQQLHCQLPTQCTNGRGGQRMHTFRLCQPRLAAMLHQTARVSSATATCLAGGSAYTVRMLCRRSASLTRITRGSSTTACRAEWLAGYQVANCAEGLHTGQKHGFQTEAGAVLVRQGNALSPRQCMGWHKHCVA